jgi:hypothetical protein
MLCDWCDEIIVEQSGGYRTIWDRGSLMWFHDYCFEDGTRGMELVEDENGEWYIVPPPSRQDECPVCGGPGIHSYNCPELYL